MGHGGRVLNHARKSLSILVPIVWLAAGKSYVGDRYAAILYARQHVGRAPVNSGCVLPLPHPLPAEHFLVVFSGDLLRYWPPLQR